MTTTKHHRSNRNGRRMRCFSCSQPKRSVRLREVPELRTRRTTTSRHLCAGCAAWSAAFQETARDANTRTPKNADTRVGWTYRKRARRWA